MASKIIKSKDIPNGYWINNKGLLSDNLEWHKNHCKRFTNEELKALENYIKAEKDEYNRKLTRL